MATNNIFGEYGIKFEPSLTKLETNKVEGTKMTTDYFDELIRKINCPIINYSDSSIEDKKTDVTIGEMANAFTAFMKNITPNRIWFDHQKTGVFTIVEWSDKDKTKTVVKAEKPEDATIFVGFATALAKKLFGSTTNVERIIRQAEDKAQEPAKQRAEHNKALKQEKKDLREAEKIMREHEIKKRMEEIRIDQEAKKRVLKEWKTERNTSDTQTTSNA